MTNQQISMVHLFIGKMADAEDLEAYVTGFYDEEGEYVSSAWKWSGLTKQVQTCRNC